jgi:uncharacterized membrane-anchored protein
MRNIIAVATLVITLAVVNWSIYKKEQLLADGKIVYLKLAPVDPRSLMQGDYMALRYAIVSDISNALNVDDTIHDGFVQLQLDDTSVGTFLSVNDSVGTKEGVFAQFRQRAGQIKIATNAYFFEEGSGHQLEKAEYGKFRVNHNGELLLVSLVDSTFTVLGVKPK